MAAAAEPAPAESAVAVPPWLGLGCGAAAVLLTLLGAGDVLLLALLLAPVAARRALGVVLACVSLGLRIGATSLTAIAGAQAVLGPAGLAGPPQQAASAWAAGLALVLAARNAATAVPLGLAAGLVLAGPSPATPRDAAVRVAGAVFGVGAAFAWTRLSGGSDRLAAQASRLPAFAGAVALALAAAA